MTTDLEKIRHWVKSRTVEERELIAKEIDYPFSSLNKFAFGRIADPSYTKIVRIADYIQSRPFE